MNTNRLDSFRNGIYSEHFEEVSSLYEQRQFLLNDLQSQWNGSAYFETAAEAHIDALTIGNGFAAEICGNLATGDGPGGTFAATVVLCKLNLWDMVTSISARIDQKEKDSIEAFCNGLVWGAPPSWESAIGEIAETQDNLWGLAYSRLAGSRRRHESAARLAALMVQSDAQTAGQCVWALGRLRTPEAHGLLRFMEWPEPNPRSALAVSLLRCRDRSMIAELLTEAMCQEWARLPLALAGEREATKLFINLVEQGSATRDCVAGLGLLGDVSAIESLILVMTDDTLASQAATALNLITGADVHEQVVEHDIDGEETVLTRLAQDPVLWSNWWKQNRTRFNPADRYRYGELYSAQSLIESLRRDTTPRKIRECAYEELVIQYGIDESFEVDMPVKQQYQAIQKLSDSLAVRGG